LVQDNSKNPLISIKNVEAVKPISFREHQSKSVAKNTYTKVPIKQWSAMKDQLVLPKILVNNSQTITYP